MIPRELKLLTNWVAHKAKRPMSPITLGPASSTDKSTWGTYSQARKAARDQGWDGIGFMFEPPYIGIDLDHCIESGKISPFGKKVIDACHSYTEYSPSGTGIHIIAKGELPKAIKTHRDENGKKKDFIEIYQTGRYFTVTQRPFLPLRSITHVNGALAALVPEFGGRTPTSLTVQAKQPDWVVSALESIQPGCAAKGRNPTFVSVIGRLKYKGLSEKEILFFLRPWAEKYNYGEQLPGLIATQFKRYPPKQEEDESHEGFDSFLSEEKKYEWIIPDVLAHETIAFFCGLPEARKTWACMDLAIECARPEGGMWLGRFPVKPIRVIYVDQERSKIETQRRFRAMAKAKGLDPKILTPNLLVRCNTTTRLDIESSREAFRRKLTEWRPALVIVDSFSTFHTKDENNKMEVQSVLEVIKSLRAEFKCTFVFVDHENKMAFKNRKGDDHDEIMVSFDKMSGSVAKAAVAETVFTVRHHDLTTSFIHHTKSNVGEKIPPLQLRVVNLKDDKSEIKVEAI